MHITDDVPADERDMPAVPVPPGVTPPQATVLTALTFSAVVIAPSSRVRGVVRS